MIGAVLIVAAFFAALQASNSVDMNDAVGLHRFVVLLTDQIGPVFLVGIAFLGTGLIIFAVRLWLWISQPFKDKK